MRLVTLAGQLSNARLATRGAGALRVRGVTPDARLAGPGMVFFALPETLRSNPYQAFAAADRGAAAVICEASTALPPRFPRVEVTDVRAAFAEAAAALHGHPAKRLAFFGVAASGSASAAGAAGTRRHSVNVTSLLAHLLRSAGRQVALLNEFGCDAGGRVVPRLASELDALELHELLARHVEAGGDAAVVELTAAMAVNLTGATYVKRLSAAAPAALPAGTVLTWRGLRLPQAEGFLLAPLAGRGNALALGDALDLARAAGLTWAQLRTAMGSLKVTPGFLEPVHAGQPFGVFVDAARTADELAACLADARELTRGRVILVTGAAAELSTAERVGLGRAAAAADRVFVTADNPRREPVVALSAQMMSDVPASGFAFEPDRARAIHAAIRVAQPEDLVVLAGKGHRRLQEIGGSVSPCDDRRTAFQALAARGHGDGGTGQ